MWTSNPQSARLQPDDVPSAFFCFFFLNKKNIYIFPYINVEADIHIKIESV